jgi:chromosome segregation ATPase
MLATTAGGYHVRSGEGSSRLMSDTIDIPLLEKMVARMQSIVADVRQKYADIRTSLDALTSDFLSQSADSSVRMSRLELARMRLAASVDEAHTKLDRIELEVERLKEQQAGTGESLNDIGKRLLEMANSQESMDAKLDLILSRLGEIATRPG